MKQCPPQILIVNKWYDKKYKVELVSNLGGGVGVKP